MSLSLISDLTDLCLQIAGLESDLKEITSLLEKCERQRVRDVLTQEHKKIEKELAQKRQQKLQQAKKDSGDKTDTTLKGYTVKINNYGAFLRIIGWDQSDKFVKIYITLKGVHTIPAENVEANFTERGFNVLVKDLDGKNHQMTVNNLLFPIIVAESSKKIKTDMVLIMCKKKSAKKWECLTQAEKQSKEKDKPNMNENADPSEGLMSMLKKIYTDGDDEMKRSINKAWVESQDKKGKADDLDF
ncbi:Calcyclin-binding protein [Anabarilius grahami]|uniref:Calcyclin-binding protein n=1 Tax=Anabarilius grahami TaxID=495550 RepID=A0A3N0YEE1_ANAGA|nr:Calcyclin-binding protein [Anabarilius grahami]